MATTQDQHHYLEAGLLIRNAKTATLATANSNIPHVALVTLAFLPDLAPVLLLSRLAVHSSHLQANPSCALLVSEAAQADLAPANPQTTRRICLSGTAVKSDDPAARAVFLRRHPYAAAYVDFTDFSFWKVLVAKAYYVGGFAAASHLDFAKIAAGP